ncbi:MFS transporter [Glaciibacter psychrotolerans]|uniref:UMF1 family MFS transporter n=1 Tax=Glaciibacter psychrotolerans TaxID=670054 RepID=A0A7Z0EGC9_9MICO|nr:MFS transporter [Leifsonia psychrotolerans]NYJ21159.1 UMF1 family MFS transporter [Leifsonia psychrotolerans]
MTDNSKPASDGSPRNFPPTHLTQTDGAAATIGVDTAQVEAVSAQRGRKGRILAWSMWDWGGAAFNAVVTTFVFTVYLTGKSFGGEAFVSAQLGWTLAVAGIVVALLAPITGQRSDVSGHRKLWLAINTYVVVAVTALMFFVTPEPGSLWLGLLLLAVGTVFFEFASVNYNAMLVSVSTPRSIGKVSGFGWSMGYFGGIVLLLIVYFGFIHPEVGLFGVTDANGLSVRVAMLISAAWFGLFALPVLLAVPEYHAPASAKRAKVSFVASYARLGRDIAALWKTSRQTVFFLISSAVFRDGLVGVFAFGGILAAGTFGFSAGEVIIFAIVANIVAGVATVSIGLLDDKIGPKPVIVASLVGLIICGTAVFVLHDGGQIVFWTFGLALCLFVGPAQSASRSFLARVIPAGREGEVFGLYATTGKAATFLAPTAFALFVTLGGAQYWGILGIVLIITIGLGLLLPVKAKQQPIS